MWSDLGSLKTVSPPVVKFLISTVAAYISNRSHTKNALEVTAISKELENENIEWSNKKIVRVCDAL